MGNVKSKETTQLVCPFRVKTKTKYMSTKNNPDEIITSKEFEFCYGWSCPYYYKDFYESESCKKVEVETCK